MFNCYSERHKTLLPSAIQSLVNDCGASTVMPHAHTRERGKKRFD